MCPPCPRSFKEPTSHPHPETKKHPSLKRKNTKNRVLFRVSFLRLESRRKSRKKFSQSIARAATSQPFSFRGTSLLEGREGVVVTQVKISVSKCVFQPNFKKKFQRRSNRVRIIVIELSLDEEEMVQWICEGKSSSCARTTHTHARRKRPPNTTPNLRIVDEAAAAAAAKMQRASRKRG